MTNDEIDDERRGGELHSLILMLAWCFFHDETQNDSKTLGVGANDDDYRTGLLGIMEIWKSVGFMYGGYSADNEAGRTQERGHHTYS